jgi:hypothetical protein
MNNCGHINCNATPIGNVQFSQSSDSKEKANKNNERISSLYGTYIDSSKIFSVANKKYILAISGCSDHFPTLLALVNFKKL